MAQAERRRAILRLLCRRGCETVKKLAQEFDVSERTIRRDIEALSLREPIYTVPGKYGGVYVMEHYRMERGYFKQSETALLQKLLGCAETQTACNLSGEETSELKRLIDNYTKPSAALKTKERKIV